MEILRLVGEMNLMFSIDFIRVHLIILSHLTILFRFLPSDTVLQIRMFAEMGVAPLAKRQV